MDVMLEIEQELPLGVELHHMKTHADDRGTFTEIFRDEWNVGTTPVQWNVVHSNPNVFRGVHVHKKHWDYLTIINGKASIALKDLRKNSPTVNLTRIINVSGAKYTAIVIPPGVAHAFYFHTHSTHVYAVSEYWNTDDELACHWNDPELDVTWPFEGKPHLSERDDKAGSLKDMIAQFEL